MQQAAKSRDENNRIKTIIRTCRLLERMSKGNPEVPHSHSIYYRLLSDYFSRITQAQDEGRFIAAVTNMSISPFRIAGKVLKYGII